MAGGRAGAASSRERQAAKPGRRRERDASPLVAAFAEVVRELAAEDRAWA